MRLFNIFIVVPKLAVATVMGSIMKAFFPGEPMRTMLGATLVMGIAAEADARGIATRPHTKVAWRIGEYPDTWSSLAFA